jgi:fluoride exporter
MIKGIEEFVFLSVGALAGAFLRYRVVSSPIILGALPINVLTVNIIGSFILGIFSVLSVIWNLETKYSLLVAIGFCGSLTTMSSFALETTNLMDDKEFYAVALNIILNVGLSLGAVYAGRIIASTIALQVGR